MERRLTVILVTDVVGYSRLMGEDETGTLARLNTHREEFIHPKFAEYRGRIVKLLGDGELIEFASVIDAVECAVAIQCGMAKRNSDVPDNQRIWHRIGINIGDVIIDGDDIYGDGVNVAARLQELAEPESVCISGAVFGQIEGKVDHEFADVGAHRVKNISKPVRAYLYRVHHSNISSTTEPRHFIDMSSKTTVSITGGCLCGEVRYEISEPAISTGYCHCRMCQRFSGAQMYAGTSFPTKAIRFTQGEPKYYRSSPLGERGFCGNCGSSLNFRSSLPQWSDWMEICTASLDNPTDFPPTSHLGVESQMPWLNIHDDLPRVRCDEAPDLVEAWASVNQDKE